LVRSTHRGVRAWSAGSLAALLALSTAGVATAATVPTDDPAEGAAGYLVSALADGERIQSEFEGDLFDAPGATADTVYALSAVGVASGSIEAATDWLETQAPIYSGEDDAVSTGGTGKLLIAAATTGRDPRSFGGVDLVARAQSTEVTADDADADDPDDLIGRYRDIAGFGDFSTPLTHSLVLLGLQRTEGADPSAEAVQLLLDQQCDDGGFSSEFLPADADPAACSSSVDTTGYAAQALDAAGESEAVSDAADWLVSVQAEGGSFGSADGQNTNSAGLAAVALSLAGGHDAAVESARGFVIGVQDGPDTETPGAIPFNADERGFVELATAQAVPGLLGVSLAEVPAAGASADVPSFGTPAEDGAEPAEDDAEPTEDDAEPTEDDAELAEDDAEPTEDDAGSVENDTDEGQETPQPTHVDSGLSPSGAPAGTFALILSMLAGLSLLGAAASMRRSRDRA
jgi:hypothetical protein